MKTRLAVPLFFLCLFFYSCADTQPEIASVYSRVIYDYEAENQQPTVRLSVFAELLSDSVRLESVTVKQADGDYYWTQAPVTVLTDRQKKKKYAGYPYFLMDRNNSFENGSYILELQDKSDRVISSTFKIDLDKSIPSKNSNHSIYYLIISNDGAILYAGKWLPELETDEKIIKKYPTAAYYREYQFGKTRNIIYLYPKKTLGTEDGQSE